MRFAFQIGLVMALAAVAGCKSPTRGEIRSAGSLHSETPQLGQLVTTHDLTRLMVENEALIEWQVARVATACNAVVQASSSAETRREALRLKASYATSSYSIGSDPNAVVQVLDLLAMATLSEQQWVVDGRANRKLGPEGPLVAQALTDIHLHVGKYARRHWSEEEVRHVENAVYAWRKNHPNPDILEFIRFEALAEEIADAMEANPENGGLFAKIREATYDVKMLAERAIYLTSRMPRLTEWHAEAAAADLLSQKQISDSLGALGGLVMLSESLPKQVAALEARLDRLPGDFLDAVATHQALDQAMVQLTGPLQQLEPLEKSVRTLERSVNGLSVQFEQLGTTTRPQALTELMERAGKVANSHGSVLILEATGCVAALLILHALLRRWYRPPPHAK